MNRRDFGKLAGFVAAEAIAAGPASPAQPVVGSKGVHYDSRSLPLGEPLPIPKRNVRWPGETYRRLLVDTHIPDWNAELLGRFDSADYVETIASAGFQCLMQYANSHAGLCLWRTAIGQMHRAMKGRDFFGEVMEQCKQHDLHRIAYYSLVYDDWAFDAHPEWRIVREDGIDYQTHSRTGTVCINSPYRQHALACLKELVAGYDFEAIYLDMTFWPSVCYCPYCENRYRAENGSEPPRTVNWRDADWRGFQQAREAWMSEFAQQVTDTIKSVRPINVYHQGSSVFSSWTRGVALKQFEASDFCAGDFYGGAAQFSLVCKAYLSLSKSRPFEFQTTRTLDLHDFETTKPIDQMILESMVPTIHGAAYLLIDALKPDGTLNKSAYEYLAQINAMHDPLEPYLGGELAADVAIYYDKSSMYDPQMKSVSVTQVDGYAALPHLNAAVGVARILREAHIPFGVVTNVTLEQLKDFRAVVLPDVLEMTPAQAKTFEDFVERGGVLMATGRSSLNIADAEPDRYLLEELLGVRYEGEIGAASTYFSPADTVLKKAIWPQENITFRGKVVKGAAVGNAQVLATITMPFCDPAAGNAFNRRFAQIWSDPPATSAGSDPGIVLNTYGKGTAVWFAAALETQLGDAATRLFSSLLGRALKPPYKFEASTSGDVEVTLFYQHAQQRCLLSMLNMRPGTPPIAVGADITIQLPEQLAASSVSVLPALTRIPFTRQGNSVHFRVPAFTHAAFVLVQYR
jgi:uncharacterized Zn-finger protein